MWKAGTGHAVEVDDEVEVEDDWETDADFVVRRAGAGVGGPPTRLSSAAACRAAG